MRVRKFVDCHAAGDAAYAHIPDDEVEKVRKLLGEKEAWADRNEGAQRSRPLTQPPVVFANQIKAEQVPHSLSSPDPASRSHVWGALQEALERVSKPVMNKPKPKVEPPKEPEPEQPAPNGAGPANTDSADPADQPTPKPDATSQPQMEVD